MNNIYNVAYIDENGDMLQKQMILDESKNYSYAELEHEAVWRFNCKKIINIWNS